MSETYSTYEAKTRFSDVLRKVRAGHRVIITLHGKEVAEVRPIASKREGVAARVRRLEERGVLSKPAGRRRPWKAIANRPGALKRFLSDRE